MGVVNAIEENPTMTTRILAGEFHCTLKAIHKILSAEGRNSILLQGDRNFRQKVAERTLGAA